MGSLTARVDDWLDRDIEEFWKAHGAGRSTGTRRVIEEWWTLTKLPALAFRDGVAGRRAVIRGGPDVWEVVMVARDYGADREGFYAHFGEAVPRAALDQALAYAERFPGAVEELLEQNERAARALGAMGLA
ncbi:MAG TPA: hypothetical protein VFQ38_15300 [Longimicrobiales bacterium]|nr:hypothetical protein [Longimicrobiales bacterium]